MVVSLNKESPSTHERAVKMIMNFMVSLQSIHTYNMYMYINKALLRKCCYLMTMKWVALIDAGVPTYQGRT